MITTEQFSRKVVRLVEQGRRQEDAAFRRHLQTLVGVRKRVAPQPTGLRGQHARDLLGRAAQVFHDDLADVDGAIEKGEGKVRQEIAGVVQAVGPVGDSNRLLFEQLRGNLRAELEPLFAAGNDTAIRSRLERLRREGADLEMWALLTTTADLHELHPDALGRIGGGEDAELLRGGPEELRQARALALELEDLWEKGGAGPWAETVAARPDREAEALRALKEGGELVEVFQGREPPVGFYPDGSSAQANADVNVRIRELAGRGRAGAGAVTGTAADMNTAIRQAAGRGTTGDMNAAIRRAAGGGTAND